MRCISRCKVIYDGQIRRANTPFDVREEDVNLLVNECGCHIVDEQIDVENVQEIDTSAVKKPRKMTKKKG